MPDTAAMNITVLGADDADRMTGMLAMFGEAFGDPETYGGAVLTEADLRRLLDSEQFIAVVAVMDGAVVGGLAAYELQKFERERSEIYIYD